MAECQICGLLKTRKGIIYEDEKLAAFLSPTPATVGHIWLTTKEHYPIVEQVPHSEIGKLFNAANKLSTLIFEGMGAHGTNIIINNGTAAGQKHAHMIAHIIPRKENDGLNLMWQPKEASEDDIGTAELKLKQFADQIGVAEEKKAEVVEEKEVEVVEQKEGEEEDYRIQHLKSRLP